MNKILVALESCVKNLSRIDAIKCTWLPHLSSIFDVKVFIGDDNITNNIHVDNNVIILPCNDNYNKLTKKTYCILQWYLYNTTYPFITICDDDIYVHAKKFNEYRTFLNYDYVGRFAFGGIDKLKDVEFSGFASGCFYILSRYAANYIVDNFKDYMVDHYKSAEDACVGDILHTNTNIRKFDETSIMPWSRCRYFDNLMVGHYMHLKNDPPLTFMESMEKMHNLYCGDNS